MLRLGDQQNGYYSSAGSVHEGIPAMVEHFGLQCEGAGTDYEKIKAALKMVTLLLD